MSNEEEEEPCPPAKKARPDSVVLGEPSATTETQHCGNDDLLALLPKEILLRIFQLLPLRDVLLGLSGASRRCRTLGLDSVTEWDLQKRSITTYRRPNHPSLQQVKKLLERLTSLRRLVLPNHQNAKSSVALGIHALQCSLNLQELRVIRCGGAETPDLFRAMGYCANWLRKIGLAEAKLDFPSPLRNLTHLSLHKCDVNDWVGIGKGCRGLEVLVARNCLNSDESERREDFCEFIQEVRQSIRELVLNRYMFDEGWFVRLARCPKLERLHWTGAKVLGDAGLESILKIPRLRDLKLHFEDSAETGLQDVNYPRVISGLRLERLEHLSLFNLHALNDDGVGAIAESCPGLLSFKLGHDVLVPITDIGVRNIVENCSKLRRLALIRCNWVTKAAFRDIRKHLPMVENVYLEKCAKIKEDCTRELLELGIGVDKWDDKMPPLVRVVRAPEGFENKVEDWLQKNVPI